MNNRFERLPDQAKIAGVCAGLAAYAGISPTVVRIIFLVGIPLAHFPALLIYAILWVVMPVGVSSAVPVSSPFISNQSFFSPTFMSHYNSYKPNNSGKSGGLVGGGVLIGLGVLFLLDRWFHVDLGDLWPFVLIAIGVWLLFRDRIVTTKPGTSDNGTTTTPTTNTNPTMPDPNQEKAY